MTASLPGLTPTTSQHRGSGIAVPPVIAAFAGRFALNSRCLLQCGSGPMPPASVFWGGATVCRTKELHMFSEKTGPLLILLAIVAFQALFFVFSGLCVYFTRESRASKFSRIYCYLFFFGAVPVLWITAVVVGVWCLGDGSPQLAVGINDLRRIWRRLGCTAYF